MKNKNYTMYLTSADVFGVDINVLCGDVTVTGTDDVRFKIERASHSHVKISEYGGTVKIKQYRKPFFHRAAIHVYVPKICLPDLSVKLKSGKIAISGGVYGDLRIKSRAAEVSIVNTSFLDGEIVGGTLNLECSGISVKTSLLCDADSGRALIENGTCGKIYLTYKSGDYGVSNFKFRDGVLTLGEGSINLCVDGNEGDYALDLLAKNGTCNKSDVSEGLYALKAYTGNGNITVDFTHSDTEKGDKDSDD